MDVFTRDGPKPETIAMTRIKGGKAKRTSMIRIKIKSVFFPKNPEITPRGAPNAKPTKTEIKAARGYAALHEKCGR